MNDIPAPSPEPGASHDQYLGELREQVIGAAERLYADEILRREATRPDGSVDNAVLDAIIEREKKVDQMIKSGNKHDDSDESQAYFQAAKQVRDKKAEAGIDT